MAHIAGLPAEELLPLLSSGSAGLWAAIRLLPARLAASTGRHRTPNERSSR